jgi:hypothetical protein
VAGFLGFIEVGIGERTERAKASLLTECVAVDQVGEVVAEIQVKGAGMASN